MNFRKLTVSAYAKVHDIIAVRDQPVAPFLAYKYDDLSSDFIYSQQEQDFTRELVNAYNQYSYWLDRLHVWEDVLSNYEEDDALELRFEFTHLPLDHCLHFPYQFKSKLAYCATQLCYTRGIAQKLVAPSEVQPEDMITFKSLLAVAERWRGGDALVEALRQLDNEKFRAGTSNYRNQAQHRHGPRLHQGHIASIQRSFPEGYRVSYAFGQHPPLQSEILLPVLVGQAENARTAFLAYRSLVAGHWHAESET